MIAALIALAAATAPPPPVVAMPPAPHPPTHDERVAALKARGFSPRGVTMIDKEYDAEAALLAAQRPAEEASFGSLIKAARANPFDAAAFEAVFRARQASNETIRNQLMANRIALLRALPTADQPRFAAGLLMSQLGF